MDSHLKKNILYVSPVGELGGAEQVILACARLLEEKGFQTSLALMRPGKLEEYARKQGIKVHTFPHDYRYRDIASLYQSIKWLREIVKVNRIDIVHANYSSHFQAYLASRGTNAKEVWHLHDYPNVETFFDIVNRNLHPDLIIYTTEKNRLGYSKLINIPWEVINPCCIDIAAIQSEVPDSEVRERFDLLQRPFFLTVARLQEHKGHRYLIDAAKEISARYPEVLWLVVGKASGQDQERYLEMLKTAVRQANLESVVRFLGFVSDNDLAALRREAFALVHPAVTEGYGLVLIEAMASGIPVIAAAADGPAEILQGKKNGLLVPKSDSEALAMAMENLLDDPTLHASLSKEGLRYVENHSVQVMCDQTIQVYDRLFAEMKSQL